MQKINFFQQSIMTDPRELAAEYASLPSDIPKLVSCVQNLVVHAEHGKLYGVRFSKKQMDEELLRTVFQMLKKIRLISTSPLCVSREPNLRLVGMCRDYCLLLVSFLRSKGKQARVRVGFSNYFKTVLPYEDHWIVEYYHPPEQRWVRVDAQLDDIQKTHFEIIFNPLDLQPEDGFLSGAESWKLCRQGVCHQEDFGYNKNWKGWQSIKGNLLHDFNCLIGLELLPWDTWTDLSNKKYHQLTKDEKKFLDEMADILSNPNFAIEDIHSLIEKLPNEYLQAIFSQLKLLDTTEKQSIDNLRLLYPKFQIEEAAIDNSTEVIKKDESIIYLKGARENNLNNIEVSIPKNKFTVVTGVSGSGKSSLVFDTIYQEGKRRYFENMNSGAKLNEQIVKPDFDVLQGLTPTIAIEQKKGNQNPRSTVGTISGIWDYLRMLYVSIGKMYCPYCMVEIVSKSKAKNHCPKCDTLFHKLNSSMFNANTHTGACSDCNGLGYHYMVDADKIINDASISILDGATFYWGKLRGKKPNGNWMVGELYALAQAEKVDLNLPWNELPSSFRKKILYGTGDKIYTYEYESQGRASQIKRPASGAINHIQRLFREASSDDTPYMQYMRKESCATCQGELLGVEARYTHIQGFRFSDLTKLTIKELANWLHTLPKYLSEKELELANDILLELKHRSKHLLSVGLHYLATNRSAPTLSGGELQRVRLSNQLGNELVGITYILDEPSIGLHPRDNHLIIETLKKLVNTGNTVIVVEHDKETMLSADYIIDVGKGAGRFGGNIIASGTVNEIMSSSTSITGQYLKAEKVFAKPRRIVNEWIHLTGACANNLKTIDVSFPLHCICSVTGVSGSGKSSLVFNSLIPALKSSLSGDHTEGKTYKSVDGTENIAGYIVMDQSPVGKSIRSSVATYTTIFDDIRILFSKESAADFLGFDEAHFSYNSKKGQCPDCLGIGKNKISLPYMADQWVICDTCKGKRYKPEILSVTYKGKTIHEIVGMEITEAIDFFQENIPIRRKLQVLHDVGLEYLSLGQSTMTLSGGESQRLKLAKELSEREKGSMLYILDEPTTGLHFRDIERLHIAFEKLVDKGHSILLIEHAVELIHLSDWIIDIGPESGVLGGEMIAVGTPEQIKENPKSFTGRYL